MDLRVEDQEQVNQSNSHGVKERRSKTGKPSWKVELRSKLLKSSKKIWVGTFKTKEEAEKACDAASHYLDRSEQYYTYPSGYFREIGELPQDEIDLKILVKKLAKEYAQRSLPIIATAPTLVTSEDPAPAQDCLALQNFRADAAFRDVALVGGAHNSVTYGMSSPRVSASSFSPSKAYAWLIQFLFAEDLEPEDQSLTATNDSEERYYHELLACCGTAVGEGSSDVAMKSAIKEGANDFSVSIDEPLESVPRLQGHKRSHSPEFTKIEDTDKLDQLTHADMCKSAAD